MRSLELPELIFSPWYSWGERNSFPLRLYPGVYLISITERKDLEHQYHSWQDVSYIGMTNSRAGLASRWRQFDRSINGDRGHSGGNTVFEELGPHSNWSENLYVAAMAVECNPRRPEADDYRRMGWVTFFEYEAFALFHEKVGGHPRYNKR